MPLSVGQVEKASALLDTAVKQPALAAALRTMISEPIGINPQRFFRAREAE